MYLVGRELMLPSRDGMVRWLVALLVLALSGAGAWAQASTEAAAEAATAEALIAEVEAMWTSGDKDVIEAKLREALGLRMLTLGDDDLAVADVLGRLGRNEWNRQRWERAADFFARALAIAEPRDPGSADTARLIGDYAAVLRETGDIGAAERRVRQSIDLRRALVPPGDPWIAAGLENLTLTLLRAGRFAEAEQAAREGLAIRRAALGPEHEATLRSARQLEAAEVSQLPWWHWRHVAWRALADAEQWAAPAWVASMLIFLVMCLPWVEARTPGGLYPLRPITLIAAGLLGGYCIAIGGAFLAAGWFPDFYRQEGRQVGKIFGLIGFGATWWLLSHLQWILAGRPPKPVDPNALLLRAMPQVRRAIRVGNWLVALPSMLIMVGGCILSVMIAVRTQRLVESNWLPAIVCAGGFVSIVLGWLWWSIAVPRWRIWSLRRIEDPEVWERAAAGSIVLAPHSSLGRFCRRTEWWTPALRAERDAIVAARWPAQSRNTGMTS